MVLLVGKLTHSLIFPFKFEDHHKNSEASSDSLHDFRSKISNFVTEILLNPKKESLSLTWLHNSFELIRITNLAFAKLVVQIDHPMTNWGGKTTDRYLTYSFNLLHLLNAVKSSASHLNREKISNFHALNLIENSPSSAAKHVRRIPENNLGKDLKYESWSIGPRDKSSKKENIVFEALMVVEKIGFLALGLVISGLCSNPKPYMQIRNFGGECEDSITRGVDSLLYKEIIEMNGVVKEVKEVNAAAEGLLEAIFAAGELIDAAGELKRGLEVLENSLEAIEKKSDHLFYQILDTRNKLMENFRIEE